MGTNRWPKNLHGQAEALLGGIPAIGRKKGTVDRRSIRGIGTWDIYRRDIHRFIEFLQRAGMRDLRQVRPVSGLVRTYIAGRGQALRDAGGSFQTLEREISALTAANLLGMGANPVSSASVGRITVMEKGGKHTEHFVQPSTYRELEAHIAEHGQLASPYRTFLRVVEAAARVTGQYAPGRGTHGLKHSFAQARMHEAVEAGLSHEEAKQAVANEIAHNRMDSVDVYLR
jgi:hypothetical protein